VRAHDLVGRTESFFESNICLLFALLIYVALQSYGWHGLITDHHVFRQTQTALTARGIARGGPILAYETPALGAPWSIPFEFPMYQTLVGKISSWSGVSIEIVGRSVSSFFFLLAVVFVGLILRELEFDRAQTHLAMCLFLLSPFYVFWSRTVLIEANALALALGAFWCFLRYVRSADERPLAGFLILGALAAAVKITTYFAFAALIGFLTMYHFIYLRRNWRKWILAMIAQVLIVILTKIWLDFGDALKAQNILAENMVSAKMGWWNYGAWGLRFQGDSWARFVERGLYTLGHKLFFVPFLFIRLVNSRVRMLYFALLFMLFFPFLVFTNLHVRHIYYAYANAYVYPIALAFFLFFLLRHQNLRVRAVGMVILVASFVLELRYYIHDRVPMIRDAKVSAVPEMDFARSHMKPEDVILISGKSWSPEIPYYLDHRALMFEFPLLDMKDRAAEALRRLRGAGYQAPLWFVCDDERPGNLKAMQDVFGGALSLVFEGPDCKVFSGSTKGE